MRRISIPVLTAVIALVSASCMKDMQVGEQSDMITEQEMILKATIASADPDTKTVRQSDNKVFWAPGDAISLFYGSGDNGGNKFTALCTEPVAVTNFTGNIGVITGGGEISMDETYFWGVYPYSDSTSCNGSSITTILPAQQKTAAGSFGNGQFPTLGRSLGLTMAFYNICGGIRFTVVHDDIRSVEFKSLSGSSIAGKLNVGFDQNGLPVLKGISDGSDTIVVTPEDGKTFVPGTTYFAVIPPTVMSGGLEVTYKTLTTKATKTFTSSISISRSVFSGLTAQDNGLTFELRDDAYVPFEDANFKAYCVENFDTDGDGEISIEEASKVGSIDVNGGVVESLKGIEYFTQLKSLDCSIKCSNVLYFDKMHYYDSNGIEVFGQLNSLDVSKNTALTELLCHGNQLTNLDISKNIALTYLDCRGNLLTSLDVSKNTALTNLDCDYNLLTSLDVSKNTALTNLGCNNNQLGSLDISKNTALTELRCYNNQLSSLDVCNNTALTQLWCYTNLLTSLDVSKNTALTNLGCYNNQLTSLDVSKNTALTYLGCWSNQLTSLDVSNNTALAMLYCEGNLLTSLDVSKNTALTELLCFNNQLASLDVSGNTALKSLLCSDNLLTYLDVSKNIALISLNCSPMTNLETLYITQDQSIPNITSNRSSSYIPATTDIVIAGVPQAVDLGLSVKWASINLGADTPWESGGYYSWGETTPKSVSECNYANYKYAENNGGWKFTKYCTNSFRGTVDNKTRLELADDAAYAELGGSWRIPTKDDWNELVANCTFTYTTMNGIPGYEVRSNKTGYTSNYIFMPLAGQYYSSSHYYEGKMGVYWSSDLVTNDDYDGYIIEIISPEAQYSGHKELHAGPREGGCTIRPVYEEQQTEMTTEEDLF